MSYRTIKSVLILLVILFLTFPAIAHSAPPAQTGTSLGDSLNLDENGEPVDETESSGGNNLGTIMSGNNQDEEEPPPDEGTPEAETPEAGTPEAETPDEETGEDVWQHPVASAIADWFGIPYEEVMALHEEGNGFGNIARAYFFAERLEMEAADLLDAAHGSGWGNVLRENGVHPSSMGNGNGNGHRPETAGPPETEDTAGQPGSNGNHGGANPGSGGPGGGNGQGQGDSVGGPSQDHPGNGQGSGGNSSGNGGGKDKGKGKNK